MKLDGRRTSSNVDDRRRGVSTTAKSVGIGGAVLGVVVAFLMGGPIDIAGLIQGFTSETGTQTEYVPTAAEDSMAIFASKILKGTEEVWTKEFEKMGRKYVPPKMILYTSKTTSGCGAASSSTGPFYCPADQSVYIDLSFFRDMQAKLGAGGDFAYAYVIAHEVGHHVQYLLGTLTEVSQKQSKLKNNQRESGQLNVRLELQADFYAGIWAYHDNERYNSLEPGDLEKGLNAASAVGDDRLQMRSKGYVVHETFSHGTSAQRSRWLKKGASTGRFADGDTFSPAYSSL